jgi:hypothetical protein
MRNMCDVGIVSICCLRDTRDKYQWVNSKRLGCYFSFRGSFAIGVGIYAVVVGSFVVSRLCDVLVELCHLEEDTFCLALDTITMPNI